MKIFSANIKDNPDMPDAHVEHDMRAIRGWQRGWAAGFWQEIGERADHADINEVFGRGRGFSQYIAAHQTPVTVRSAMYQVLDAYWVMTHKGLAGVSPDRGYSVVIVKHRIWGYTLALIGTHFVSGAWYGEHSRQPWRRNKWNLHFAAMAGEINALNYRNISVVFGGDFNRKGQDIPKFTPQQVWGIHHGYDHIGICPAHNGAKVTLLKNRVFEGNVYTDHKPIMVKLDVGA